MSKSKMRSTVRGMMLTALLASLPFAQAGCAAGPDDGVENEGEQIASDAEAITSQVNGRFYGPLALPNPFRKCPLDLALKDESLEEPGPCPAYPERDDSFYATICGGPGGADLKYYSYGCSYSAYKKTHKWTVYFGCCEPGTGH